MQDKVNVIPGVQTPRTMVRYVAGFAFDDSNRVLLVRKKVPNWQSGLLNGVGGKIEGGETPGLAMEREFSEETTVGVVESRWKCFCVESHQDYEVHFFRAQISDGEATRAVDRGCNDVGEELRWFFVNLVGGGSRTQVVGNLQWLIPMAKDWRDFQCRLTVSGNISERPTW